MARIKPVKPSKAKRRAGVDAGAASDQVTPGDAEETRQTRGITENHNESRQTRGVTENHNESRQTRGILENHNESRARS